ncbi:hypothetical protein [Mesorhizobium sp. M0254]|uniref:hypothetical protein n=1 Tax=Mesorhizobium sp. M0254 TaxID=2956927 RepID=UPI00333A8DF9
MSKLTEALSQDKLGVCLKLEASEVKRVYRTTELLPDFDFIPYDGGTDKDYPVWHEFDLSDEAIFIHSLILDDYGYFVDDDPHDDPEYELPKATSESTGKLALELQMADRFGCRALVRGSLSGTSMEMNMDVRFNFIVASYSGESSRIGYAAEAIAEGFAFEEEGKLKQAFFSYFSALDSFVESEREKLNKGQSDDQRIKPDIRLMQKLQAIIKANMPPSVGGLDKVKNGETLRTVSTSAKNSETLSLTTRKQSRLLRPTLICALPSPPSSWRWLVMISTKKKRLGSTTL